jgi:GAF domain-containing protein
MGDNGRDERERVLDAPVSASQVDELREQDLERRERQGTRRTAQADQRQRWLDDREHDVGVRETDADQREYNANVREEVADQREVDADQRDVDAKTLMMRLSALALALQDLDDVDSTVRAIVAAAVDTVPATAYAGLTVISGRQLSPIVTTHEVVTIIDGAQQETGEGPALTSLRERRTVRVDDIAADPRWPRFGARAAQAGVRSLLAIRLSVHRNELGVLTLYSRTQHAFDDDAEQTAVLFAAHAAVALAGAQHDQHMAAAMTARDDIGQAKGILMERHRLTADQAFAVLVRTSQDTNTKLVDVVRVLLQT